MVDRTINYNNMPVSFKETGKGVPIVFLHGYLESSQIWQPFVKGLPDIGRIILIDLPGHGESGVMGESHAMDFMADVVKHVLDSINVDKCIMIGHSMGGYVTLSFARGNPDRVLGYSLFHSHPLSDTEETKQNRMREIDLVREGKKELIYNSNIPKAFATENLNTFETEIEYAKKIACQTTDKGIINALKGMMERQDYQKFVASTPVPLLWILGKKDNYIDYRVKDKVILGSAGSSILLNNSGHMGFLEERERCLGIIIDFIKMNQLD